MIALRCKPLLVAVLCGVAGCSNWEGQAEGSVAGGIGGNSGGANNCPAAPGPTPDELPPTFPVGLHVVGNQIHDADGNPIILRGVNRSGTEYKCAQGTGIFEGPSDEESVRAIASWRVNAVRVPLNESCWLGTSPQVDARFAGDAYKAAIVQYVNLLHKYRLVPILELHFAAPGSALADKLWPMPNVDNTPAFWQDLTNTFIADDGVVFELYNEPFPGSDSAAVWACWRDGCDRPPVVRNEVEQFAGYEAVGMQGLVTAIRDAEAVAGNGIHHLILAGGIAYSNNLSRWLEYQPQDPAENLAAAWHVYNFNACTSLECSVSTTAPAAVAAVVPVVATEIGQDDCAGQLIDPLMKSMDEIGMGYLAWWWNTSPGACVPATSMNHGHGAPLALIEDYYCPVPKGAYGRTFRDHLLGLSR